MRPGIIICVVDDDGEVRESIGTFFRSAGLKVVEFDAAETLLRSSELDRIDCLITDLHMPGMDGLQLHRELTGLGLRLPVVLMTAFPTDEVRSRASAQGVSLFIEKPADPELLLQQLEKLLAP